MNLELAWKVATRNTPKRLLERATKRHGFKVDDYVFALLDEINYLLRGNGLEPVAEDAIAIDRGNWDTPTIVFYQGAYPFFGTIREFLELEE